MNSVQLLARVRSDLDEVRGAQFANNEILRWINDAIDAAWLEMKQARQDYFLKLMSSTDSASTINGISYNPSSLALVSGTRAYTLPPDLVELKRIRSITSSRLNVVFVNGDEADPYYIRRIVESEENTGYISDLYFWDITGERTLRLAPIPREALNIEILYVPMLASVGYYGTGTIQVTNANPSVVGTSTAWTTAPIAAGDELMSGFAESNLTSLDTSIQYPVIKSIDSATGITLETNYTGASLGSQNYLIGNAVTQIPRPYHPALVEYATARGKGKDRHPDKAFWAALARELFGGLARGVETRQIADPEFVQGYLESML